MTTNTNPTIRFVRILARLSLVFLQLLWFFPGILVWGAIGLPVGLITYAITGDDDLAEKRGGFVWFFWPMMLTEKIPLD